MYRFRGNKILFGLILAVIMIPPTVSVIGFYKLIVNLGMYDTWWPLIIPAVASPYTVFFLRQYVSSSFHPALLEAARIDGAKELYIFHRLGLPLITPAIATMSIFGFLASWNNYLLPLTVLNSQDKYTLPLLIQMLNTTTYYRDQGALYAGVAISIIPIMIAFIFFSRYILGVFLRSSEGMILYRGGSQHGNSLQSRIKGLPSRSFDPQGRRRLLHRHLHLRMVSGSENPLLPGSD